MELKQEKILGGIGAILTLFFIIPFIGWIISLVGLILIAISIKGLGDKLNEKAIFKNYLTSIILFFISILSLFITAFSPIMHLIKNLPQKFNDYFFDIEPFFHFFNERRSLKDFFEITPKLESFLLDFYNKNWFIILVITIIYILLILGAIFKKKSYDKLSEKIKINEFKICALLIFLGAILQPIFGIGIILILIGIIFEIISFFSIKEKFEIIDSSS